MSHSAWPSPAMSPSKACLTLARVSFLPPSVSTYGFSSHDSIGERALRLRAHAGLFPSFVEKDSNICVTHTIMPRRKGIPNRIHPRADIGSRPRCGCGRSGSSLLLTLLAVAGPAGTAAAAPPTKRCKDDRARAAARSGPALPERARRRREQAARALPRLSRAPIATQPALEPIVAAEGGPGYPSIDSAESYLFMLGPLRRRHDLIVMDNRGTGRSERDQLPAAPGGQGRLLARGRPLRAPARAAPRMPTAPAPPPTTSPPCSTSSACRS